MVKPVVLILILLDVLLNVTGQLALKHGMSKIGNFSVSLATLPPVFFKAATNLFVLFGLFCYGLGFLVWLIVLSKAEVSYAYPLISLGYVFTAVLAWYPVRGSLDRNSDGGDRDYLPGGVLDRPELTGTLGWDRLSDCPWGEPPAPLPGSAHRRRLSQRLIGNKARLPRWRIARQRRLRARPKACADDPSGSRGTPRVF